MAYDNRTGKPLLSSTLALAAVLSLSACDKGSLGEFESETESGSSSDSGSGSTAESSTSGASMSTSLTEGTEGTEGEGTSAETGDPTETSTTGPVGACQIADDFSCGAGVDCEVSNACGTLDSYFDDDGCLRPTCRRNSDCGAGEVCYYDELYGGCASSSLSCDDDNGECECGGSDDCGGAYCVPAELLPGGVEAGPTQGWIDRTCAPDDGLALAIELGLAENACFAAPSDGLSVRMVIYTGDPSSYAGFPLTGEFTPGGGFAEISDDGGATTLGAATGALRIFNWGEDTIEGDYEITVEGGATYMGSFSVPFCNSDVLCG